ncbi:hypothetical protein [Achromobacter mucicolens]|uniref:hypothetical protein n=1 Tax=Achromobacter mucicolens TaxID=1389922 RepID=UPI0028A80007|nr:hypothetical protein [Achromobacter mucicolens]
MPRWFDRAEEQIESDYDAGLIDAKEYQAQMRDLQAELREAAQEEADRAYRDFMDN